jgi:hypothetical protein
MVAGKESRWAFIWNSTETRERGGRGRLGASGLGRKKGPTRSGVALCCVVRPVLLARIFCGARAC